MAVFSRLSILKANDEKKSKSSICFPCNNILYSAVCFLLILLCIGQTVSHGQTMSGDQIIRYRILNETYNPDNAYQWKLIVEVNYSYNTAHGTMPYVCGELAPYGPGFTSGYNHSNCAQYTNQTQQGNIIYGTQRVNIDVSLTNQSHSTNTIALWLAAGANTWVHRNFPFQRVWNHNQAKRIKYTIENKTPFTIKLIFYPSKNTDTLDSGKKTNCNSPIRNGAFPTVQATATTLGIQPAAIQIAKHGGNYYIVPVGARQIAITLGKN